MTRAGLSVGAAVVACCSYAGAQLSHQALATQSGPSDSATTALTILVSARSKDGTPAELSAADLEIKIDGKPATVGDVRPLGKPAIRYCLLVDTSGSTRPYVHVQLDDAVGLLSKIPQAGRDYGLLVDFSDEVYLDGEGTDPQKLLKSIHQFSRGGTAVYDAMVACAGELSKSAAASELRVMFILSDGDDNSSHVSREETLRTLVRTGIRVYAIGHRGAPNPTEQPRRAIASLKQFAEKTGGQAYFPKTASDDEADVSNIAGDLGSVFSVTVSSARPLAGDRYYKLEVKSPRKDVSLGAPQQYFAPLR